MKLSNISNDKIIDIALEIIPIYEELKEDKKLIEIWENNSEITENMTEEEKDKMLYDIGSKRIKNTFMHIATNHRDKAFTILALLQGKDLDEVKSESFVKTLKEFMELSKDDEFKEIIRFFTLLMQ